MTKSSHTRPFALILSTLLLSTGGLFATSGAAQADDFCPSGNVCFWRQNSFQGGKAVHGNSPEGVWRWVEEPTHNNYRSIKNHFDNRAVWTADTNGNVACTNPGTNRPAPPLFSGFLVGGAGSRC